MNLFSRLLDVMVPSRWAKRVVRRAARYAQVYIVDDPRIGFWSLREAIEAAGNKSGIEGVPKKIQISPGIYREDGIELAPGVHLGGTL
jgi:hypothetical protein